MSTNATPAQRFAAFAASVAASGLTDELRDDVTRRTLDFLGNSFAALPERPAEITTNVARSWGGNGGSTALGSTSLLPAPSAALINGTLGHSLDFDDTHLPSVLHPSSAVLPAALAVAEQVDATGSAFLDAAAVGIELTCRLGMAGYDQELGNSVFFDRGLHATAICGAIGAAVAAGMLYRLDADTLTSVIGIAASMGAGVIEANRTGGTIKRVHCGWAAHCGVAAADFARFGLTGPPTVLEGRFGFLRAFCGDTFTIEHITNDLGARWELQGIFFKPYPCNHFTHAGIDAALSLRQRGIDTDDIRSLTLGVPAPVLRTIAEPPEDKARPGSGYHAAFSGPFTVATALLGGGGLGVSHNDFTDNAVTDQRRLDLARKVTCIPDQECTRIFPNQFPAVLTAELTDGTTVSERITHNRGGPQRPLSDDELTTKFTINAHRAISSQAAQRVASEVRAIRDCPITRLTALLRMAT
jgi:2-methylcitrate dehydratase PrpD